MQSETEKSSEQTPQCAMCGEPEPNLTLTADSFLFGVNLVVCQECNEDPLDRATVEASERFCPSCERDDKTVDVWTTTDPANPRPDYVGCARCEIMGCFR